ncbi:proline-, glutamic acid- and leucine-rich protein 1-like [Salmo trutta]|uniref:proline-, glutamic acid- and leucine-rich protein 1-like n=1 Tax=Salmo trutta TaxID=8032 RepID=UPI0011319BB3|nr:proline-, glutamic acid- and leucine-rich protein 1-like [Salmo trutta]
MLWRSNTKNLITSPHPHHRLSPIPRSKSLGQNVVHINLQVAYVPEDPEEQAEEDDDGPREDQKVPEAEGCKDAQEEQDEAHSIQEDGDEEEEKAAAQVLSVAHGEESVCREGVSPPPTTM